MTVYDYYARRVKRIIAIDTFVANDSLVRAEPREQ